ncbi:Regulator of chromosome condensation (RCC1) repeat [Novymonas esmeraldas]|uniref:Regulator of chromosome condensation (RCC1) repeat n=1 Tax=Novymonas esmeraldas TaxID=1808958 RepID=A0AAW0F5Q8_9TRYP
MFFWGSYNFQEPQLSENPDRPPLRYPAYIPPSVAVLRRSAGALASSGASSTATASALLLSDAASVQDALRRVTAQRMQIHHIACGTKHLVAAISLAPSTDAAAADPAAPVIALYGMGNNECGQLGHHVPNYATTLTHLHLEELMEGTVVSIACGARHTLVCTSTGCVYVTGDNSSHQLGLPGQMVKPLAKGGTHAPSFTQLKSLAHVKAVYAGGNASFALDRRGQVYSWGEAKYGHLGHNDNGERLDTQTLKTVATDVATPQLVRWFERHRVTIVEVAVGKSHMVCRSEEDVYTCGEPFFGKLGHGDIDPRLEPTRVEFPPRKQVERLLGVAAGDDHTLVLKENDLIGSVVYFFGKLSGGDGQLRPMIVQLPTTSVRSVVAGRGTFSAAITHEGHLYVWGKHAYPRVYNGTAAAAARALPSKAQLLDSYVVGGVASGGTFVVAYAAAAAATAAAARPTDVAKCEAEERVKEEVDQNERGATTTQAGPGAEVARGWDVVVPHDARVGRDGVGDPDELYEEGLRALLRQYLGPALGAAYAAQLPAAPPRSAAPVYQFQHVAAKDLSRGQKVRLWMTNVYALGTIVDELSGEPAGTPSRRAGEVTATSTATDAAEAAYSPASSQPGQQSQMDGTADCGDDGTAEQPVGKRVKVEWQRDDWDDEVVTLYSEDETLNEENANRWQPFWFEQNADGEYVTAKLK